MKKIILTIACTILCVTSLFSEKFKLDTYYVGSHEEKMIPGVDKHLNEYGYMIWTVDTIVIDGKYDYQFFEIPNMRASEFSYSTIKNDSKSYEMNKRGCPSLVSFVDNIKASSTLKDKNYSYDIENVTFPCRPNCYVQNLPWAEGKADEGIGESIEFDIMSVYDAYSDGAGRKEIRGDIKVSILNGFVNPYKQPLFYENNRIKKASIYVDGKKYMDLTFNDFVEFTEFEIPAESKHVKIVIDEVYKGTKYNDTCVTKIDVFYYMNFLD